MELVHLSCVLVVFSVLGISVCSSCDARLEFCLKNGRMKLIDENADPFATCRAIRGALDCLESYDYCPDSAKEEVKVASKSLRSRLKHCELLEACSFDNAKRCLEPLNQKVGLKPLVATTCPTIKKAKRCLRDFKMSCRKNKNFLASLKSLDQSLKAGRVRMRCHTHHGGNRYKGGYALSRNETRISVVGTDNVDFLSTIELNCTITPKINLPYPDVVWSKDGKLVRRGRFSERSNTLYSRLQISYALLHHAGVYTCRSYNSSRKLKARFNVKVSFVEGITGPTQVAVGSPFEFSCTAMSPNLIRAYWLKDGREFDWMSYSERWIIDTYNLQRSTLFNGGAKESDAGVYECFVSNKTFSISLDVVTTSPSTSKSPTTVITTQSTAATMKPRQFPETTELKEATTNQFEGGQDAQTEYFQSQIQLNKVQMEVELRNRIQLDLEFLEKKLEMGLVDSQDRHRLAEEILSPLD